MKLTLTFWCFPGRLGRLCGDSAPLSSWWPVWQSCLRGIWVCCTCPGWTLARHPESHARVHFPLIRSNLPSALTHATNLEFKNLTWWASKSTIIAFFTPSMWLNMYCRKRVPRIKWQILLPVYIVPARHYIRESSGTYIHTYLHSQCYVRIGTESTSRVRRTMMKPSTFRSVTKFFSLVLNLEGPNGTLFVFSLLCHQSMMA